MRGIQEDKQGSAITHPYKESWFSHWFIQKCVLSILPVPGADMVWYGDNMIKMYAGPFLAVLKLLVSPGRWYLMLFTVSACSQV